MKPSERIGNLLYNEAGEVTEVVSITKTHINGVELSKWRPIPFDNTWLQRIKANHPNIDVGIGRLWLDGGNECRWAVDYDYLHQLQNIYFDLTGTDIKIQP